MSGVSPPPPPVIAEYLTNYDSVALFVVARRKLYKNAGRKAKIDAKIFQ